MPYQFTTLYTADLLDDLVDAVDAARTDAAHSPAWLTAINKAFDYILTADVIRFDMQQNAIEVPSATTDVWYTANGDCQCKAFTRGKGICWHRAAARLVRRALERATERERAEREAEYRAIQIEARARAQRELLECFG